ncbi:glycosyltransferase [Mucilaginibacter sp.]|uniref:glycosyltransferase n=1 Tax=Mucilaginibacter sp. TaxID=1882438 RepID=UPI00261DE3BD|nr:glycosyltransferase [Mucilaginibacter sp.]MDB4925820.1 glycosyltransferase [Mucilaginibacter sp.]
MKTNPCITVLMPAYNTEKYISEAIESVLQQTHTDFELIIVNDGSTDGTKAIINSYKDERIILIDQPNMGVAAALNTGLKYSKAPYIARFDADDVCHPQRLEKQIKFLLENPEYILVGSDADYILENNDFLFHFQCIAHSHQEIMEKLYFYCPFMHPTVMYKKANVANAGGYPTDAHNFEDYLLWTAIAKEGKFCNLAEPLIKYRLNSASVTIDERWRGKRFRELKRDAIKRGHITAEEGNELLAIIKSQDVRKIKEGSYHALCGKKFLANNYQPEKAREHVKKAISIWPLRLDNYLLYTVSYLPEKFILWLHKMSPNKL